MEDRRTEKRWRLRNCCRFNAVTRTLVVRQGAACSSSEARTIRSLLEFRQRSGRRPRKWPSAPDEQYRPALRLADHVVGSARQTNPESSLWQTNPESPLTPG